jgi:hypothetical protein
VLVLVRGGLSDCGVRGGGGVFLEVYSVLVVVFLVMGEAVRAAVFLRGV